MNPYSYKISLRIWHPTIDPARITKELDISPTRMWLSGERRTTPKGGLLEGAYKESYWCGAIHNDEKLYSRDTELEEYINNYTKSIQKHFYFFNKLRAEGGRVEYFVGLYINNNSGSVLPFSLLLLLGKLGIDLALDFYPEQNI